jgi:dienelactone hydrolase
VHHLLLPLLVGCLWVAHPLRAAEPLPDTKPLDEKGDLARVMVDGIHKYLDRELAAAPKKRDELWKPDLVSKEALAKSLPAKRERLKKILGVVDERVKPNLEYVSGPGKPSLLAEIDGCKVHAVRWAVLPGVDAEGLLIEPKGAPKANVVAIPHADQLPEELAGLAHGDDFALRIARHGCRVLIPTVIDRKDDLSGNAKLKRQTNLPHREFVYRMAYEMGRTLTGYEVQKVLAAVDWFEQANPDRKDADKANPYRKGGIKTGVIGYGDGGTIALYAGALDERIASTEAAGYFAAREHLHEQPIDRNQWALLKEFGDAELGAMIRPRRFQPELHVESPKWTGPLTGKSGRSGAAPGTLIEHPKGDLIERRRFENLMGRKPTGGTDDVLIEGGGLISRTVNVGGVLHPFGINYDRPDAAKLTLHHTVDPTARHARQFNQLVAFTQKLWRDSDATRKEFWKMADSSTPAKWEASGEWYRNYFHAEVIGKLPEPTKPLNVRTRQTYDEKNWTGHEVVVDVYDDVIAYGILLLPKDLKPGEKRPVVVCQHGLEGRPQDIVNPNETKFYRSFGAKLADMGYIVYAPQNPYIFQNHFRQIQRKANPLKLSLFSFIIRQHQRTLDWLETLPQVDAKKIAFYGLSYGGKTAMRVPAVEKRYCLSICSGDFNEWIGKNVSVDLDRSYMWTGEYEMYEFDLGNTFNYAEMAYLIAPRPFMVERGHDDGVGTDEMVAYEYAKVRYLYANKLKLPERAAIDFQPGGHEIFLKGTLDFLEMHVGKARK